MSRIAKKPIVIPTGVKVDFTGGIFSVKGEKGSLSFAVPESITLKVEESGVCLGLKVSADSEVKPLLGTAASLVANMIFGVSRGFERKLVLVGVGYKATISGRSLSLYLGYSQPISYSVPEGVSVDLPSQTEIVIKGANKQIVGAVASDIRSFRVPEPYKGKGVRYSDEVIVQKEGKKR